MKRCIGIKLTDIKRRISQALIAKHVAQWKIVIRVDCPTSRKVFREQEENRVYRACVGVGTDNLPKPVPNVACWGLHIFLGTLIILCNHWQAKIYCVGFSWLQSMLWWKTMHRFFDKSRPEGAKLRSIIKTLVRRKGGAQKTKHWQTKITTKSLPSVVLNTQREGVTAAMQNRKTLFRTSR